MWVTMWKCSHQPRHRCSLYKAHVALSGDSSAEKCSRGDPLSQTGSRSGGQPWAQRALFPSPSHLHQLCGAPGTGRHQCHPWGPRRGARWRSRPLLRLCDNPMKSTQPHGHGARGGLTSQPGEDPQEAGRQGFQDILSHAPSQARLQEMYQHAGLFLFLWTFIKSS